MTNNLLRAAMIGSLAGAAFADVTYRDGTFAPGTWGMETQVRGGSGSATADQVAGVGNPDFAYQVRTNVNGPVGSQIAAFHRFGTDQATRYDPATQGEIPMLFFAINYHPIQAFGIGQGLAFALKQGQRVYITSYFLTGGGDAWSNYALGGLNAGSFSRLDGGAGHPDFTPNGAPIRFGFVTSSDSSGTPFYAIVDYDNFYVSVIPAPGACVLLAGAATLAAGRRRR